MTEKILRYLAILILIFLGLFFLSGKRVSASSLFDADEDSPFYPEIEQEENTLPDYATNDNGEILINNDTTLNEVLNPESVTEPEPEPATSESAESVSGGDAFPDQITLADMESLLSDSLAETYAANLSIADAYLSSAIVDVFSRVVDGSPSHYKYAAYRLNASDNNEGYLLIGPDAKVNGNYLEFNSGSQLCHYYRTQYTYNYQTYYNYKYDVTEIYDTYRIPYRNGQLIYTNMVSGFPVLSENNQNHIASIIIPVFIAVICLFIMIRRKK